MHGHGLAENRLGSGLGAHSRDDYVLSTKVGRILEPAGADEFDTGLWLDVPRMKLRYDYSYDGAMRSIEDSLQRMLTDRIDIALIHDCDMWTHGKAWQEPFDVFLLARQYTLLDQGPLDDLFPECAEKGTAIFQGGAFHSGILPKGPSPDAQYDFAAAPPHILERVQQVHKTCSNFGIPMAAAALQFAAAHPVLASVLVGSGSIAQQARNLELMQLPIPAGFWDELRNIAIIREDAPIPA